MARLPKRSYDTMTSTDEHSDNMSKTTDEMGIDTQIPVAASSSSSSSVSIESAQERRRDIGEVVDALCTHIEEILANDKSIDRSFVDFLLCLKELYDHYAIFTPTRSVTVNRIDSSSVVSSQPSSDEQVPKYKPRVVYDLDNPSGNGAGDIKRAAKQAFVALTSLWVHDPQYLKVSYDDVKNMEFFEVWTLVYHVRALVMQLLITPNKRVGPDGHEQSGVSICDFKSILNDEETCKKDYPAYAGLWSTPIHDMTLMQVNELIDCISRSTPAISFRSTDLVMFLYHVETCYLKWAYFLQPQVERNITQRMFVFRGFYQRISYARSIVIERELTSQLPDMELFTHTFMPQILSRLKEVELTGRQEIGLIEKIHRSFTRPGDKEYFNICHPNDRVTPASLFVKNQSKDTIEYISDLVDMPIPEMYQVAPLDIKFCILFTIMTVDMSLNTGVDLDDLVYQNPMVDSLFQTPLAIVHVINRYTIMSNGHFFDLPQDPILLFFHFLMTARREHGQTVDGTDCSLYISTLLGDT